MKKGNLLESAVTFSLWGIPVTVKTMFFLIPALLGSSRGINVGLAIWIGVIFCSILLHELGHAVVMQRYGYTPAIELGPTGGLTFWGTDQRTPSLREQALVSLAGPIAGFIAGGGGYGVQYLWRPIPGSYASLVMHDVFWVNIIWGIFNLLPILPLDGGSVMESFLCIVFPDHKNNLAHKVSLGVAIVVAVGAFSIQWTWPAMIAAYFGVRAFRHLQATAYWQHDTTIYPQIKALWDDLQQQENPEHIIEKGHALLKAVKTDEYRAGLLELLAWTYLQIKDMNTATMMMDSFPQGYAPSHRLQGVVLLETGRAQDAMPFLLKALKENETGLAIMTVAKAFYELQQYEDAVAIFVQHQQCQNLTAAHIQPFAAKLFYINQFEEALTLSKLSFTLFGQKQDAYNTACCLARSGHPDDALEWLKIAIKAGYADKDLMENDTDLESVRLLPGYAGIQRLLEEVVQT